MKAISVFNNKGGVGKTTLLCNIASYLAKEKGKKVLIIDADPQCNATIYLFKDECIDAFYETDSKHKTIYNIVLPYKKGKDFLTLEDYPIEHSQGFGVDCLIGDTHLGIMEDFLSMEWLEACKGTERSMDTTFVFKKMVMELATKYDYIFFDIGPSLGAINRAVLLSCDYFIIPMASDVFCLKAIDNISSSLDDWHHKYKDMLDEYEKSEKCKYTINGEITEFNLKFLGYCILLYNFSNDKPVKAYEPIIANIPAKIESQLCQYAVNIAPQELKIGEVPKLNSMVPMSQTAKKPIFNLSYYDGVVGGHVAYVESFKTLMENICYKVEHNISADK